MSCDNFWGAEKEKQAESQAQSEKSTQPEEETEEEEIIRKVEKREADLIVLTRNAPTTWYEDRDGIAGPEYDLVMSFAKYNDLTVKFIVKDSIKDILEGIEKGEGDIAAAGLTHTDARQASGIVFGPDYFEVRQQVVCRRNHGVLPRSPKDLIGRKIKVISASSYEESLNNMKLEHPELDWEAVEDVDTEELLEDVWLKKIDCTLADSNIVSINRRYYPELIVAFSASENQPLAWVLNPELEEMVGLIKEWLKQARDSGDLVQINERYYGHIELFDYVDMSKYSRRIGSRLPKYKKIFQTVAKKYEIPWTLLAAQSYQESHWNPKARSPTGVRGLMMLTRATASMMGVANRLDPQQSIEGGAKYLRYMYSRLSDDIQGEDRVWFALAAYNVGLGHLFDARKLAIRLNKNQDLWVDLREVLPLLSKRNYHKTLKHGYARGGEPVRYVKRIRSYYQVLEQYLASEDVRRQANEERASQQK